MVDADIDAILEELGGVTLPLFVQLVLLSLPGLLVAFHMTAMVFLGFNQDHRCTMPRKAQIIQECNITWTEQQTKRYIPWKNITNSFDSCSRYTYDSVNCTLWGDNETSGYDTERCDSWTYNQSVISTTVVGDFNLVCDNKQKRRLSQAVFMLGVTLGVALLGQLSDKYGRKKAAIFPMVVGTVIGIATAFSKSFILFTVLRFFIGFTLFPSATSSYVAATEMVNQNQKVWFSQIFEMTFGVGICILSAIAYFVRDWRSLQLWISTPAVLMIILLCFTHESPRWLVSKKDYSKANNVIKKLITKKRYHQIHEARKLEALSLGKGHRNCSIPEEERTSLKKEDGSEASIREGKIHNDTIIDILKLPNMRNKSLILFYIWTVISALYYGLTLNAAELGGNAYLNLFLSAAVDIPASLLAVPMIKIWGRRPTLTLSLTLSGVVCICMMFVSKELIWLNITLSTIGKFSISASFGTAYIYSIDIYPTPVRNVGVGVCSSWARIGGMLAPFIAMLDVLGFAIPYLAFGLLAVIGGFLGLLLPETRGRKIPETLEEAEQFANNYEGIMASICGRKDHMGNSCPRQNDMEVIT